MPTSTNFRDSLAGSFLKILFRRRGISTAPVPVALGPSNTATHTISTVPVTRVSITIPTSGSLKNKDDIESSPPKRNQNMTSSNSAVEQHGAGPAAKDTLEDPNEEAKEEETTQVLPTRYIKNVDNLVQVMQAMVGEKGTFQIEVSPC